MSFVESRKDLNPHVMSQGGICPNYDERLKIDVSLVAKETLKHLISGNIPLIPQNYKDEFERLTRTSGKREVEEFLREEGAKIGNLIEPDQGAIRREENFAELTEETEKIVHEFMEMIESLKSRSDEHNRNLDGNVTEIKKIVTVDDIVGIKEKLLDELKKVKSDNRYLKERLEITSKDLKKKTKKFNELKKLVNIDSLTKIANRRTWDKRIQDEVSRVKRYGGTLSVVFVDIDHFKKINDTYGHQTGDKVLVAFSSLLWSHLREADFIARYGGDEFSIILPEANLEDGKIVVERIREELKKNVFVDRKKEVSAKVSASFGITEYKDGDLVEDVIKRADTALYMAKENGRDRVEKVT